MKAAIFVEPGRIVLDEKPIPEVGPLDALLRITTTTICGAEATSSRASIRWRRA
jgi:threonine dehydrogenase-like Zn-dependent dehydrogenase